MPESDSTAAELMGPYYENEVPTRFGVVSKLKPIVKQNMLRRRIDDDPVRHFPKYFIHSLTKRFLACFSD